MSSAWSKPLRALATHTAVITIIGLGLAAPATAAQGDQTDKRNDKAAAAKAESSEKKSTKGSAQASSQASSKGSAKQETRSQGKDPADHQTSGTAGTSGTPPEPQPLSKADKNDGGANGECPGGPYCGTKRDEPSANGNGDGKATGKPCAGCVGKADNKNPKGQYPDAKRDGNRGYECDDNKGIGRGNPAHTACDDTPTSTTGDKCPDGSTMPADGKCDDGSKTCPNGKPMPESGDVKDCNQGPKKCPDGTTMPTSGDIKDCKAPNPQGPKTDIGGEETVVVTPPGSNRPPAVTPPRQPVVAGVETLVPPAGVELTVRPQGEAPTAAPQALPGAAALPATGATAAMTALSALAFGMLALGAGLLFYRRVSA